MAFRPSARRLGALALVAAASAAAACSSDPDVRGLTAPSATNAGLMLRYVALGNSITAGFQSNGINDSTQRASYANLLARAAGVRFAYPSLINPGCPPPLTNLLAGTRVGGGTAATCPGRTGGTDLLNNVAVPGANSFDPTGAPTVLTGTGRDTVRITGGYSALTRVILGNLTQVQKAVQANPTFASVWIGNNDVLAFAVGGDTAMRNPTTGASLNRITPPAAFAANYAATVNQLQAGSPNLKNGVLIGVVDVTNTPQIFQLSVFNSASTATGFAAYQPAAFATLRALFGVAPSGPRPATFAITFAANCANSLAAVSLSAIQLINAAVPANAPGYQFNCAPGATPSPVLDDAERAVFVARVAAYNAYIKAKADSIGFFYYDPNVRLAGLRATPGAVLPFINLQSTTQPFGANISLDGVHPSTRTHVVLASDLRDSINAKYGASIGAVDTTGLWTEAVTFARAPR